MDKYVWLMRQIIDSLSTIFRIILKLNGPSRSLFFIYYLSNSLMKYDMDYPRYTIIAETIADIKIV